MSKSVKSTNAVVKWKDFTFIVFVTWPKNFVFGQVLFSSACMCLSVCVCLCVCLSVSLSPNYLKRFLTDFNEAWHDGV